jgi:hypothetical protein
LIEIVKYDSTQKLVKKINTPSIINSTKPVLYDTGDVNFPYAYAGTCYPVKWENNFYIRPLLKPTTTNSPFLSVR